MIFQHLALQAFAPPPILIAAAGTSMEPPRRRTMKAALQNYQDRMRRVLDHIDRHLDE